MYKQINFIKKNIIMILVFIIISFFGITITYNIALMIECKNESSSLFSDKSVYIDISENESVNFMDLKNALIDDQFIIEYSIDKSIFEDKYVNVLYYNKAIVKTFPIEEGRMFSVNDFLNMKKYALIGRDLSNEYKVGDKIKINESNYVVIGILGGNTPALDNKIYITYSDDVAINEYPSNLIVESLEGNNTRKLARDLQSEIERKIDDGVYVSISDNPYKRNSISEVFGQFEQIIIIAICICLLLIITVINVSIYNIDATRKEFGVKKLIGYTNLMLVKSYIGNYLSLCFISSFFVSIIYIFFKKFFWLNGATISYFLYFKIVIFVLASMCIIGLLTCGPMINKILKIEIAEIIREEE